MMNPQNLALGHEGGANAENKDYRVVLSYPTPTLCCEKKVRPVKFVMTS